MKYLSGSGHRESYTLVARKRYMKKILYVHKNSLSSNPIHRLRAVFAVDTAYA